MAQEKSQALETTELLDEISITATRTERKTSQVPAAIVVVSEEKIADAAMVNIKDALQGTPGIQIQSQNGGYDSRLSIRGAGLKAAYGVREIMVLLDGVPITDPDSFTRLDLVDTQLIERIEVVKGPNSTLWGANAAGGVINIITKSPNKDKGTQVKVGAGSFGAAHANLNHFGNEGEVFYSLGASHRESKNSWRRWNEFSTNQLTLQPNWNFADGDSLENRVTYSEANLQLPGSLDHSMFQDYLETGEAKETAGLWQYSGRYSKNLLASSKYKTKLGGLDFIPMIYANQWSHLHPVYARINRAETLSVGTDVQFNKAQDKGTLTFGFSQKLDQSSTKYYKYGDITTVKTTSGYGANKTVVNKITALHSDEQGDLIQTQESKTSLSGVYVQESLQLAEKWLIDMGVRFDSVTFNISGHLDEYYNSSATAYATCSTTATNCDDYQVSDGDYATQKTFTALSPRVGVSYQLAPQWNLFGNLSQGVQTPTEGEIRENPDLKLVTSVNYEAGAKLRNAAFSLDASYYQNLLTDEVVQVVGESGTTQYANAGKTSKKGVELSGEMQATSTLVLGASFTAQDYRFKEFNEPVRVQGVLTEVDRSGNRMPYTPAQQYSIFTRYRDQGGFKASLSTETWGAYYVDNENSEQYEGFQALAKAMVGWEGGSWDLKLNVDNLTDKRYATEVKKSYGEKYYTPAAPRSFLATAAYLF